MKGIPSVEALEACHAFPGSYILKIFGEPTPEFQQLIETILKQLLDTNEFLEISSKLSSKGNHVAITLNLFVQSAHKIRMIYSELVTVDGVRMLM